MYNTEIIKENCIFYMTVQSVFAQKLASKGLLAAS